MAFLQNLIEKLEAQQIYNELKGKYETRFVVEGETYAFLAETIAGDVNDDSDWMLYFENIQLHRLSINDNDKKVIKSFIEVVDQWVKDYSPHSFIIGGAPCELCTKIIEGIKKKVKKYNVIDETEDRKTEDGMVVEGNPVGKVKWTKSEIVEAIPSEDLANTKQTKVEQTYEDPKEIKLNKKYMKNKKDEKLDKDKESGYGVKLDWASFKADRLNENNEESQMDERGAVLEMPAKIKGKDATVSFQYWPTDPKEKYFQGNEVSDFVIVTKDGQKVELEDLPKPEQEEIKGAAINFAKGSKEATNPNTNAQAVNFIQNVLKMPAHSQKLAGVQVLDFEENVSDDPVDKGRTVSIKFKALKDMVNRFWGQDGSEIKDSLNDYNGPGRNYTKASARIQPDAGSVNRVIVTVFYEEGKDV